MTKKKERLFDRTLLRLVQEARPIRWWLALSVLLCGVIIACAVAGPELLGSLVDRLYAWDGRPGLGKSLEPGLLVLLGIYVAQGLVTYGNQYLLNNVVSRFFTWRLRIRISDKLQRVPISYLDKTPAGEIIDRLSEDVGTMGMTIHGIIEILFTGFLQIAIITLFMFLSDWRLALAVVAFMPLSLLLSARLATKSEKYWNDMFNIGGDLYAMAEENVTNFSAMKAFNLEAHINERMAQINKKHNDVRQKGDFLGSIVQPVITFTNALCYIVIALLGGWLVLQKLLPVGTVVTVILFARQFSTPLERIAGGLSQLQQAKAAARRVFDLLDLDEEAPLSGSVPRPVTGEIRFEDVNFRYVKENPLIQNLNIHVKPGQNVAIVGPTGAGKTTIVNLLMRFYDVDSGRITIGGQDGSVCSRDDTRSLFGMVLQDTWLFEGSVAENVAYGKPDATREQIQAACRHAYCDRFIRTLPQGYDTKISEDSTNISSGQKQLLTIARAPLADRRLLILDEATSNVDTRTEILIQKAMDRLMKDRTCFIIAHRLSTIVDADLILVLRDGRIVEQGTHRALLAQKGFYYELYQSQYAI